MSIFHQELVFVYIDPFDNIPISGNIFFWCQRCMDVGLALGLSPRLRHIRFMVHVCHLDSETCGVDLISWLFLEKHGGHFPIMDDEKIFKD